MEIGRGKELSSDKVVYVDIKHLERRDLIEHELEYFEPTWYAIGRNKRGDWVKIRQLVLDEDEIKAITAKAQTAQDLKTKLLNFFREN